MSEGALTREVLDAAFRALEKRAYEPPFYVVAPHQLRLARIAWSYLHGLITREEYRRLFFIERWLLRSERA